MLGFQRKGENEKVSECKASEGLTYRHLYEQSGDISFGVMSKHSSQSSLEILQKHNIPQQYKAFYELGKIQQTLGEEEKAARNYEFAIENFEKFPDQFPYGESVTAEMRTKLYALKFKMGDNDAYSKYEEELEKLRDAENPDEYGKKVWISGSYMHGAEAMIGKDKQKSLESLVKASDVIGEDEMYKLRRRQIEKLRQEITS